MKKFKRYIPGTNPKWGRELRKGELNSLVDKNGCPYDNGYNFDEKDDDFDDIDEAFDKLSSSRLDSSPSS